jgi:autotransporter passenger strand-loop-strand repeat protein
MSSSTSVTNGNSSTGLTLNDGDLLYVSSGGTAISTTVDNGGQIVVSAGGSAVSTTVSSGGDASIGGVARFTIVSNGGVELVSGGSVSATTVSSGGVEKVLSGGTARGTTVAPGGAQFVSASGAAISTTVDNGGVEFVYSSGTASFTTIASGDALVVYGGGSAFSATIADGGILVALPGALLTSPTSQTGADIVSTGVVLYEPGSGISVSGHAVNGIAVGSGALEYILPTGTATDTTVDSFGSETVFAGGLASRTTVASLGTETVLQGGSAVSTTVTGGGFEIVSAGGTISGAVVNDSTEFVFGGGTAVSTTLTSGANEFLFGGTASGTTVSSGAIQQVYPGGTAIDTIVGSSGTEVVSGSSISAMVASSGTLDVYAGGTASDTTVGNGGVQAVYQSGTASGTIVQNGGTEEVSSFGSAIGTMVGDGGFEHVSRGGLTIGTTVLNGSFEVLSLGGRSISTTLSNGATEYIEDQSTASDTSVSSGGAEYVFSGSTASGTRVSSGGIEYDDKSGTTSFTTVENSGLEYVYSAALASGTTVSAGGYEVVLNAGATAVGTTVDLGGAIDIAYLDYVAGGSATLNSSSDVLSVTEGSHGYTQQLSGSYYAGEQFQPSPGIYGGTTVMLESTPCYCRGTRILTERGEIAVEDLRSGDRVVTFDGALRPIRWIGYRQLDLLRHAHAEIAQPILIRRDAFADGVPCRDLRVSPDHAVLLDGGLIAARLLLNGASVVRETACRNVTYYHVELQTHDILLAEMLPAESYLDTGNRGMFQNAAAPLLLHPGFDDGQQRRVTGSCRPFVDAAAAVEPIWRRLAARAATLGFALPAERARTQDPALCVVIGGRTLRAADCSGDVYSFVLPRSAGAVRLVSRAVRPCELRPWVEDRRRLGVMVSRLTLTRGAALHPIPLDHPLLSRGWWDVERDRGMLRRWTDGDAELPLPDEGPAVLAVVVVAGLDYPLDIAAETPAAAAPAAASAMAQRRLAGGYTVNCSATMRSDRPWSGSNKTVTLTDLSSRTATDNTSRTSVKSATAAVGRFSLSSTSNKTSAVLGSNAPRQRRGRNAEIGVSGSRFADSGTIGPCADKL